MKILVILGGTLTSTCDIANAYKPLVPRLLQEGLEGKGTPFANHEILAVFEEEAINAFFDYKPDRIVFLGTYYSGEKSSPAFILLYRILTRGMDKHNYLFTNPISVPPFNDEENFFTVMETDEMAQWLGL